jgi:RRXRR protein
MLPQFGPLEGETADKLGIGTKRVLLKRRSATFPRGDCPQGQRNWARKGLFGVQKLAVFVLDKRKKPLMPCFEKRARLLLTRGRAVVHRGYRFTIRLKDRIAGEVQTVRVVVRAEVPNGKKAALHVGRVAVRASGSFRVGNTDGVNAKHCRILQRADGYGFVVSASPVRDCVPPAFLPMPNGRGFQRRFR